MSDNKPTKPSAFIFGKRPDTVTASIKFTSVTGAEVDIECKFKYRTRKEFSQLWDELAAPVTDGAAADAVPTFAQLADKGLKVNAQRTLQYLSAWPLDLELNVENVLQLFDEEPDAPGAFWNAYRAACTEGRRGN